MDKSSWLIYIIKEDICIYICCVYSVIKCRINVYEKFGHLFVKSLVICTSNVWSFGLQKLVART